VVSLRHIGHRTLDVILQRPPDSGGQMVKCSQDQVKRLKKALQREKDPIARQRIQMILLREDGKDAAREPGAHGV
jgi:hypothetical protein